MANPSSAEAESEASDRPPNRNPGERCSDAEISAFRHRADELISKANDLEHKVNDVLHSNAAKKPAKGSSRDRRRDTGNPSSSGKRPADGSPSRRMQELMRQFGTILKQLSQHKWIWLFMEPVDVKGLGLHDYYELNELDMQLEALKNLVIQKCRKFTVHEKRKLGAEISSLSAEDLDKALEIIAEGNPNFQASTNAAEIDMDAQSEKTLWKLKFFVQRALEVRSKNHTNKAEENMRRKKEICDALTKTAKRRHKR